TTAFSPLPVWCSVRRQPGLGANESIEKPLGTVITTFVVNALSFSVGTARLYSWSRPLSETDGLSSACAEAADGAISEMMAAVPKATELIRHRCRCIGILLLV